MEHHPLRRDPFGPGCYSDANTSQCPTERTAQTQFVDMVDGSSDFRAQIPPPLRGGRVTSCAVEWRREASSESMTPLSQESRPLSGTRRVACVESSTEPARHFGASQRTDNRMDSRRRFEDRRLECLNRVTDTNGDMPSAEQHELVPSFYDLSLESAESRWTRTGTGWYGSEVVSRRSDNSPVSLSAASSLTHRSPTTSAATGESDTNKKLSKNAKRRMKKKQKKQTEAVWPKLSCICPTDALFEAVDAASDANHASMATAPSEVRRQLRILLSDTMPNSNVRFREQGIRNLGNTCFLGSAMQFLLASSQFCSLMIEMKTARRFLDKYPFPVVCSMGSLANVLTVQPENQQYCSSAREVSIWLAEHIRDGWLFFRAVALAIRDDCTPLLQTCFPLSYPSFNRGSVKRGELVAKMFRNSCSSFWSRSRKKSSTFGNSLIPNVFSLPR